MTVNHFETPVKYGYQGEMIVRMRGITKVFHTAAGEISVLKGINVDVRQGEFVSVVGRSGSGKSTLVNALIGQTIAAVSPRPHPPPLPQPPR